MEIQQSSRPGLSSQPAWLQAHIAVSEAAPKAEQFPSHEFGTANLHHNPRARAHLSPEGGGHWPLHGLSAVKCSALLFQLCSRYFSVAVIKILQPLTGELILACCSKDLESIMVGTARKQASGAGS